VIDVTSDSFRVADLHFFMQGAFIAALRMGEEG
jgi:hypothetical protein